jgi:hypothetical protein
MCSLIFAQPILLICLRIPKAGWRFCLSLPQNLISREGKTELVVWPQRHVAVGLLTRVAPVQMLFWTPESAHCLLLWQFFRYKPVLFLCNKVTSSVYSYLCRLGSSLFSFLGRCESTASCYISSFRAVVSGFCILAPPQLNKNSLYSS